MKILDTCALIYWTLDPVKLSESAKTTIEKDNSIGISSISIWEIGIKVMRKKLIIPITIDNYLERLQEIDKLIIIPVDAKIWLENLRLPWKHKDPADRTIVATARLKDCALLTSDNIIAQFYGKTIW